ncbi:Asp23/Gls24 family envelope stress response protein [Streptomyces sp. NPDC001389]|uniref:Asp23/Gls24 family envelope stress response protein n=1 Tax=Streptomyces sp. NPDC001389 TaxID=3364569 RepID=UPI0036A18949
MSTRPGFPVSGEGPGPPDLAAGLPPPAERGATVIPDRVVARIAAQAARTAQARRAAIAPDRGKPAAPSASAAIRTGSVRLHLDMDLPYPTDIARVCERIQHDVAERVAQLTGLEVGEVTLTVRRLATAADPGRGRVQ